MPRKSTASLAVVPAKAAARLRPAPPVELSDPPAQLWRSIVESLPADWFSPADLPLLREYCQTCAILLPQANASLESGGVNSKALITRDTLIKSMVRLAEKLRLCVSTRTRPDQSGVLDATKGQRGVEALLNAGLIE